MLYFLPVGELFLIVIAMLFLCFDIDSNNLDALVNAIKLTENLSSVNRKQLFNSAIRSVEKIQSKECWFSSEYSVAIRMDRSDVLDWIINDIREKQIRLDIRLKKYVHSFISISSMNFVPSDFSMHTYYRKVLIHWIMTSMTIKNPFLWITMMVGELFSIRMIWSCPFRIQPRTTSNEGTELNSTQFFLGHFSVSFCLVRQKFLFCVFFSLVFLLWLPANKTNQPHHKVLIYSSASHRQNLQWD